MECRGRQLDDLDEILKLMELDGGLQVTVKDSIRVMLPTLYVPFERKGQASGAVEKFEKL